jgi:hypothetical protein
VTCQSEPLRQGLTRRNGRAETSYQAGNKPGDLLLCVDSRKWLFNILGRLKAAPAVGFRQTVPVSKTLGRNWDGAESRAVAGFCLQPSQRPSQPRAHMCIRASGTRAHPRAHA